MNNENTENSVEGDHQSLINILLQHPEDFNLKQKPSGIRENKMFTLDMREIPISSAKADDNGAYHVLLKEVLQSSICTMRRDRAHPTKMVMAYGMSIYETLKVTGKKSFQQTKYLS